MNGTATSLCSQVAYHVAIVVCTMAIYSPPPHTHIHTPTYIHTQPLQKAIELSVSNTADRNIVDSYDLLASVISMNDSRLQEALTVCNEGISLYPKVHQLLSTKCGILVKMNHSHEAIALCEDALKENSYSAVAYYHLGTAHLQLNRVSHAESALWNSVMLDSSNRDALYLLATILQGSSNQRDLLEAQKL